MADCKMDVRWTFTLNATETRLLLRVMSGLKLSDQEAAEAKELGDRLAVQRAEAAAQLADILEGHAKKAKGEL